MITFKPEILPSGTANDTRWREHPTPKIARDGYTIAQYSYDSKRCGHCKPYYRVYFNSNSIDGDIQYKTLTEAKKAANKHSLMA